MEYEGYSGTNFRWFTWKNPQRINKGTWRLRNQWASRDLADDGMIKIGQNTKKSPGDLKKLAITQIPVRNRDLTLVWKKNLPKE